MNKRELARVLVRVLGVYMVASAIPSFVASLVTAGWTFWEGVSKFHVAWEMGVRSLVQAFLQLAIGLFLFYRGGMVAKKLLHVDETHDA
jgi:sterol desaturase/sphingolipid hydroxylase (fatty acid hydroxylase superfamily)